jgi:two-component system response regulator AtoC
MRFLPDALELLEGYDWRGNVRELQNLVERCVLLCGNSEISKEALLSVWSRGSGGEGREPPRILIRIPVPLDRPDLKAAVREVEKQMIRIALERTDGSRPRAADLLGISHPALLYKAKAYGLN